MGPFVDVGDGFTPETGITLGAADEAELLKAAGAATVDISGATWAAITGPDGWYDLTLTTSHTDTVGELIVVVQDDSVCLPVYQKFQVITADAYDYIYASDAAPDTQVAAIKTETAAIVNDTDLIDDATSGLAKIATDVAAVLVDTGTTLDTNISAIKTATDKLTFTVANQVDSNIQSVNDVTVTGTGASGDEWGP